MTDNIVLNVSGVSKRFGGLQALSEVGIQIQAGQVYGLIGPNGAGKTTFFNVITGLYTPDAGSFTLGGTPYTPQAVHQVAKAGIARTFQNIRLFADMTAIENVMVGRHIRTKSGLFGAVFRSPSFKAEEAAIRQRSQELLDYVGIGKFAEYKARTLSYGDQRRLEIARALATDPKLIALDEPAAGMNATEKVVLRELIDRIVTVNDEDAYRTARELATREGIFAGLSSGAACWAALTIARELGAGKHLVVIFPDHGERYASAAAYFTDV